MSGRSGFSRFLESNDFVKVEFKFISKLFNTGDVIECEFKSIDFSSFYS